MIHTALTHSEVIEQAELKERNKEINPDLRKMMGWDEKKNVVTSGRVFPNTTLLLTSPLLPSFESPLLLWTEVKQVRLPSANPALFRDSSLLFLPSLAGGCLCIGWCFLISRRGEGVRAQGCYFN